MGNKSIYIFEKEETLEQCRMNNEHETWQNKQDKHTPHTGRTFHSRLVKSLRHFAIFLCGGIVASTCLHRADRHHDSAAFYFAKWLQPPSSKGACTISLPLNWQSTVRQKHSEGVAVTFIAVSASCSGCAAFLTYFPVPQFMCLCVLFVVIWTNYIYTVS